MGSVQLPLENVAFALEQYLLANGQRLDPETRALLAGVRDCVGRVVVSARRLSRNEAAAGGASGGTSGGASHGSSGAPPRISRAA